MRGEREKKVDEEVMDQGERKRKEAKNWEKKEVIEIEVKKEEGDLNGECDALEASIRNRNHLDAVPLH